MLGRIGLSAHAPDFVLERAPYFSHNQTKPDFCFYVFMISRTKFTVVSCFYFFHCIALVVPEELHLATLL